MSFGHKRIASKNDEIPSAESEQKEAEDTSEINYLFQNLNLRIEAGTSNAIVGPSGFGKTSMLHLLFRIYDPQSGEVLIDG